MFDYIDLLKSLWRHTYTREEAATLPQRVTDALAEMELRFPAWDATINRHNVLHLAEAISRVGSCHVTSTLPFERLWKR